MIWTGGLVGLMKLLDFLLGARQKLWISDKAATAWLWLSDQRAGKYIALVRSRRFQTWFAIIGHLSILVIISGFLFKLYLNLDLGFTFQFSAGHPRLYPSQVWVDVAAVAFSMALISFKAHPLLMSWVAAPRSTARYLGRCAAAWGCMFLLAGLYVVLLLGVLSFDPPEFQHESESDIIASYEQRLGGVTQIYVMHAITSMISAPIMVELLLLQTILFMSIYWIIIVWVLSGILWFVRLFLLRISESRDGPILALSAFLVGVGAIAKAILDAG